MADGEGLRVQLQAIKGITDKGLLKRPFFFQCPPLEEFSIEYAHSHTDYETVSAGQFSRRGGLLLRQTSFDTLFVDQGSFTVTPGGDEVDAKIEVLIDELVEVVESGSPFLLTVAHQFPPLFFENWDLTEAGPELQMPATMRTLRVSEKAGEGDARYASMSFTEYRDPVVGRNLAGKRRGGGTELPLTGSIVSGGFFTYADGTQLKQVKGGPRSAGPVALVTLSKKFYGTPNLARHIGGENGLGSWGVETPINQHPKYKKGGKLKIPRRFDPFADVSAR